MYFNELWLHVAVLSADLFLAKYKLLEVYLSISLYLSIILII